MAVVRSRLPGERRPDRLCELSGILGCLRRVRVQVRQRILVAEYVLHGDVDLGPAAFLSPEHVPQTFLERPSPEQRGRATVGEDLLKARRALRYSEEEPVEDADEEPGRIEPRGDTRSGERDAARRQRATNRKG